MKREREEERVGKCVCVCGCVDAKMDKKCEGVREHFYDFLNVELRQFERDIGNIVRDWNLRLAYCKENGK